MLKPHLYFTKGCWRVTIKPPYHDYSALWDAAHQQANEWNFRLMFNSIRW